MRSLATLLPLAWPRLLGVAMVLVACVLTSAAPIDLAGPPSSSPETTLSSGLVATAPDVVALPALTSVRGVLQSRVSTVAFAILLALVCWPRPLVLPGRALAEPPRAAPGRRGRALLHAYLN
jgi:hypothetical protein